MICFSLFNLVQAAPI
uniref:Uncharacterized protein n=1 Tax=Arundo donax TaxID=35708 RepID=A0A0A9EFG2_ARUDO